MLVLTRRMGETILVGPDIKVTVLSLHGRQVRLAVEAPAEVGIWRAEILARREPVAEPPAQPNQAC